MSAADKSLKGFVAEIRAGERRALAKAITLIESARSEDRSPATALLDALLPHTGGSIRLGVTGVPGVGKSTFTEVFGQYIIEEGRRVAVLAIDPSSKRGGGSILGDKTRMENLARSDAAFIRPSPARGTPGGVARRTREAMLVCEAAGFDVVMVETVGVGQAETAVADMVDMFLLLLVPSGGDELQGIKRGVMELADAVIVNKADGEMKAAARRTAAEYHSALGLMRPPSASWSPPVLQISSLTGEGVPTVWECVLDHRKTMQKTGAIEARRSQQARAWMWSEISEDLNAAFREAPGMRQRIARLEAQVAGGKLAPTAAAERLLAAFLKG
ncbi:MAG: methylmalonyl Co-A mutase-associated GTPase MeaB [Alphaproteobacteria bacterium]